MTINELRAAIETERARLRGPGGVVVSNQCGPVCLPPIEAILAMLETQQSQIEELQRELAILRKS